MVIDQCPIPWANMSLNNIISFEYDADGPRLVCNNREDIASICTNNGSWYPNPAEIICTQLNGLLPYVIPNGAIL